MIAALSLLALLAAEVTPKAALAAEGKLTGKVTVAGLAPKLANLPVTRDMKICSTSKTDEALELGAGGGVKNAVIWIAEPVSGEKPVTEKLKVKLDQQACAYVPHVLAMPAGATLEIVNSDAILHNAHATEGSVKVFNYAMPIKGQTIPKIQRKPGVLKLSCDVHAWMHAYVHVLPTRAFAVTDADGNYQIDGLPPGKYTVKLWQERLGEREEHIEVTAGATTKLDLSLVPR